MASINHCAITNLLSTLTGMLLPTRSKLPSLWQRKQQRCGVGMQGWVQGGRSRAGGAAYHFEASLVSLCHQSHTPLVAAPTACRT